MFVYVYLAKFFKY